MRNLFLLLATADVLFSIIVMTSARSPPQMCDVLTFLSQDNHALPMLFKRARAPQLVAPLGHEKYFESIGTADTNTHTYDW